MRSPAAGPCAFRLAASVLILATVLGPGLAFAAGTGRWTPKVDWRIPSDSSRYAIHMLLLPGDGAMYHSRIL